jgi:hypothetical protein
MIAFRGAGGEPLRRLAPAAKTNLFAKIYVFKKQPYLNPHGTIFCFLQLF